MPVKVAIYVPSKSSGHPTARQSDLRKVARNFFLTRLGGCTEISAIGYFDDPRSGKAVEESLDYFFAYTTPENLARNAEDLKQIAHAICVEFDQTSAAIEVSGAFYTYSPDERYRREYIARRADALRGTDSDLFLQVLHSAATDEDGA